MRFSNYFSRNTASEIPGEIFGYAASQAVKLELLFMLLFVKGQNWLENAKIEQANLLIESGNTETCQ